MGCCVCPSPPKTRLLARTIANSKRERRYPANYWVEMDAADRASHPKR